MHINYLVLILGLYFFIVYFFVKKKHRLGFALYGKYLIKGKNIKNKSKLESDISIIQLIFGSSLIFYSIVDPNIFLNIFIWIILSFYVFKTLDIRKKILQGVYD